MKGVIIIETSSNFSLPTLFRNINQEKERGMKFQEKEWGSFCRELNPPLPHIRHSLEQINKSWHFTTIKTKKRQVMKVRLVARHSWKSLGNGVQCKRVLKPHGLGDIFLLLQVIFFLRSNGFKSLQLKITYKT